MLSIVGVKIAIGTLVPFLSPFTSRTILNLFAYFKLFVSVLFVVVILVENSLN